MGVKGRMQWYIRAQLLFVLSWVKQMLAKKELKVSNVFTGGFFFFLREQEA